MSCCPKCTGARLSSLSPDAQLILARAEGHIVLCPSHKNRLKAGHATYEDEVKAVRKSDVAVVCGSSCLHLHHNHVYGGLVPLPGAPHMAQQPPAGHDPLISIPTPPRPSARQKRL
uniref:Uncharacterized protein n=1 Tax=Knipowitschia caucasica TaxID=637954 RepID=A0AAV2LHJ4_KNICA